MSLEPIASSNILLVGGTVFTVDSANTILRPGWIRIRGSVIAEVSAQPLAPEPGEMLIDARDGLVLPGMVNTHAHLFQILLRGVYDELPLSRYLNKIYRSGLALTPDDERIAARLGAIAALRSGVTTIVDHHFVNPIEDLAAAVVEGVREVGLRIVLARTIMDLEDSVPKALVETPAAGLAAVEGLRARFGAEISAGVVDIWTGPNTPGVNATAEAAIATREYAEATGTRRSAHVAEYRGALEAVARRYGYRGVVEWLDKIGALGPDLLAVHAVHVTEAEVVALASSGVSVSHNPFSNLFCGHHVAPVRRYLAAGMRIGLGTDGDANNNGATVLDALRLTRMLQQLESTGLPAISPVAGLRMATVGGAEAIGKHPSLGSLEPGKRGDVVVFDIGHLPHSTPMHDPLSHLLHHVRPSDARTVIVDGRVLMRDGTLLTVDEEETLARARSAAASLVSRLQ